MAGIQAQWFTLGSSGQDGETTDECGSGSMLLQCLGSLVPSHTGCQIFEKPRREK
jgi:hypothetical protein